MFDPYRSWYGRTAAYSRLLVPSQLAGVLAGVPGANTWAPNPRVVRWGTRRQRPIAPYHRTRGLTRTQRPRRSVVTTKIASPTILTGTLSVLAPTATTSGIVVHPTIVTLTLQALSAVAALAFVPQVQIVRIAVRYQVDVLAVEDAD